MRILSLVMALLFLFAVAVQYNDPDPVQWMAIYGAAALLSALVALGRPLPWWVPAGVGLIALIWSVSEMPGWVGKTPLSQMFAEYEMKNTTVEMARESFGLLIVTVWMAVLALTSRRSRRV